MLNIDTPKEVGTHICITTTGDILGTNLQLGFSIELDAKAKPPCTQFNNYIANTKYQYLIFYDIQFGSVIPVW